MSRVVYVGGFANGRYAAERVGNALGYYFEQPEVYTFSDWVRKQEEIERAAFGVTLITHSAGALALECASPSEALLFNPPLPRKVGRLICSAAYKQARLSTPSIGIHTIEDAETVLRYTGSSVAEMTAHPVANFGQISRISKFDSLTLAQKAIADGIQTELIWTENDKFFSPYDEDLIYGDVHGIPIRLLLGEHDELVIRPNSTLQNVLH